MRVRWNQNAVSLLLGMALAISLFLPAPETLEAQARRAAPAQDRFEGVRTLIRQALEEHGLPSVSVAVAKDGRIVWEEAFGWADRERMIEPTPHTLYSLASISKPMTATGIMKLVEQGKVDLDRPANDYLGTGRLTGLADDAAGATVRRVLSHTAGLPLHYQFFYANGGYVRPSMDETIARYALVLNLPGQIYQYSNLGYGILDHIIARASGQSYEDFMRTEVFLPLGMTRTSVHVGPGLEPFAAVRYDRQQRPIPFYDFDHPGGSAVYSSAHDLIRFGMFHLKNRLPEQRRILADSTIDAMQRIATPGSTTSGYGLGWAITEDDHGYRRVSHTGGMPGVNTALYLYPAENVAIVAMTNTSHAAIYRIAEEIAAVMLPRYAGVRAERQTRPVPPPTPVNFPAPELQGAWTGTLRTYEGELPLALLFQPDGDVHVRLGDQLRTLLNGVSYREDNLIGRFAGTIPTEEQRRHPHSILLNLRLQGGSLSGQATAQTTNEPIHFALTSYVTLTKVEEVALSAEERARYVGTYTHTNLTVTRLVFEEGGRLKLQTPLGPRTLLYQGDHTFVAAEEPDLRLVFRMEGARAAAVAVTSGAQTWQATRVQ